MVCRFAQLGVTNRRVNVSILTYIFPLRAWMPTVPPVREYAKDPRPKDVTDPVCEGNLHADM